MTAVPKEPLDAGQGPWQDRDKPETQKSDRTGEIGKGGIHKRNKRDRDSQSRSEMLKEVLNGGKEEQLKRTDRRRDGEEDPTGLGEQGGQGPVGKEKGEVQPLGTGRSCLGTEREG